MKKIILTALALFLSGVMAFSQTATNFMVDDCDGNSTDLFKQLDSGKVVVLMWVMPCAYCISVASDVNTTVDGYDSSNPGRVLFYLADDFANTTCSTLDGWANQNSISPDATFSDTLISMYDYGSPAMQKTLVLGGYNHTVFYNTSGAVSVSAMQTAINSALAATGIKKIGKVDLHLRICPNPVADKLSVSYSLNHPGNVKLEVLNILGESVKEIKNEKQSAGQYDLLVNAENMITGIYFLKVSSGDSSQLVRFTVTR